MTAPAIDPAFAELPKGTELVLLVEDNEQLCALGAQILLRLGYKVITVPNGAQAEALPAGVLAKVDLLITDIVMPEVNGLKLVERLFKRELKPAVLYTSGYVDALPTGVTNDGKRMHFLPKPWTPRALATAARAALDSGGRRE